MNVSLTKELENFIGELVASGMHFSASEVVRDGLRLLKEQEALKKMRVEELRAEIMLRNRRFENRKFDVVHFRRRNFSGN